MKNNAVFLTIFAILLACSGCTAGNKKLASEYEPEYIEVKMNDGYSLIDKLENSKLAGTVFYADNIIACDSGDNNLVILNEHGEDIGKFGSLGNGTDEFINPTGIDISGERLYVLDAGNQRIQIYDNNFTYLNSIVLDSLANTDEVYYTDISVSNEGIIYLTTNSSFEDTSRVYIVDIDGNIKTSTKPMCGFTYSDGETAYCINTYEIFQADSSWTASFSHNYLYAISEDGTLTEQAELPYKYGPTDFVVEGDDLYVLSCGWARLDHFTTDGVYVETIYKFDELYPESYLTRTSNGFVVTDRYTGITYILSYEQN